MVFTFEQQHGRNWNTSSATTTPSPTTTINRTTTSTMINSSNTTTTIIPTLPPLPPPSYQHNHHHHTNTTTITPPTPRPLPCFNHHYTTTITTTTIKPYNKRRRSSWTHGLYEYTAFEHLQMCLAPHDYTVSRNSEWLDTFRVVVVDFRVLEQSRASLWRRSSISAKVLHKSSSSYTQEKVGGGSDFIGSGDHGFRILHPWGLEVLSRTIS